MGKIFSFVNSFSSSRMISVPKSRSEVCFSCAGAVLLLSIFFGGAAWNELSEIQSAGTLQATRVTGILEVMPKRMLVRVGTGVALDCPVAYCGYPGAGADADAGKIITVDLAGGRVVGVLVDGQYRDFRELRVTAKRATISNAVLSAAFAIALGVAGFFLRPKVNATRNS